MAAVLLDTNILTRYAQPAPPHHAAAAGETAALRLRGESLVVVPQVLYEFWAVCTRPLAQNGLGMDGPQTR